MAIGYAAANLGLHSPSHDRKSALLQLLLASTDVDLVVVDRVHGGAGRGRHPGAARAGLRRS